MPDIQNNRRKPNWLKISIPSGDEYVKLKALIVDNGLHTICSSGKCPNMAECWGAGTATFMILGNICTRACKFCAVESGKPLPPDLNEPHKIANSVRILKLKHCVITSVDRDDLPDGGSALWAETILKVKEINPSTTIEALIPDFNNDKACIDRVIEAAPEVISHNLETVRRLTPSVRSRAKYDRSLEVIKHIADSGRIAKSGIMLGLGETFEEIYETMDDLLAAGCTVMTLGQYLQPRKENLPVINYITPDEFDSLWEAGLKKGFKHIESSPLVRSSYHAEKHVL